MSLCLQGLLGLSFGLILLLLCIRKTHSSNNIVHRTKATKVVVSNEDAYLSEVKLIRKQAEEVGSISEDNERRLRDLRHMMITGAILTSAVTNEPLRREAAAEVFDGCIDYYSRHGLKRPVSNMSNNRSHNSQQELSNSNCDLSYNSNTSSNDSGSYDCSGSDCY